MSHTSSKALATALSHRVRTLPVLQLLPLHDPCSVITAQDVMDVKGVIAFSKFRVLYYDIFCHHFGDAYRTNFY